LPDGPDSWPQAAADADLLVNCTPLGTAGSSAEQLSPLPAEVIQPGMLVYDLVYRPSDTPLLIAAERRGARTLGGLSMLIYQGAASFKIWTGLDAPVDVMFSAARTALAEEGRG
jgi:shikimate dehydrogenase